MLVEAFLSRNTKHLSDTMLTKLVKDTAFEVGLGTMSQENYIKLSEKYQR